MLRMQKVCLQSCQNYAGAGYDEFVNCGETHMIAVQSTKKAVKPLTFWDAAQVTCI